MDLYQPMSTGLSRRSVLAGGGALLAAGLLPASAWRAGPAAAATYDLIWNEWGPLAGYRVSAECNPGGTTSFSCDKNSDVAIATASDATGQFTEVKANPRGVLTFVNAIGN